MSPGELDEIVSTGDAPQVVRVPGHYWHGFSVVGDEPAMLVYFVNMVARARMRCAGPGTIRRSFRRRSTARWGTPGAVGCGTGSARRINEWQQADGKELTFSRAMVALHLLHEIGEIKLAIKEIDGSCYSIRPGHLIRPAFRAGEGGRGAGAADDEVKWRRMCDERENGPGWPS